MHRLGLVFAWLLVASAATALTWGVLSSADRETTGGPSTGPIVMADASPTDSTNGTSVPLSSSTTFPVSTTPEATVTSGDGAQAPATTVRSSTTSTTAVVTEPPATTTTTTLMTSMPAPDDSDSKTAPWTKLTVPSGGGVVVVSHRPEEVRLESAAPLPGFTMEIDKAGPDEVEVEFDGAASGFEVQVRWENGVLNTEVTSD